MNKFATAWVGLIISQPHIRPLIRGKSEMEFGAKISACIVDGFTYVDRISFDTYNEGLAK